MSTRFWAFVVLLFSCAIAEAATDAVTVNATNRLVSPYIPYSLTPTGVGNSPAWRDSATVIGLPSWIEGYEAITPGAAVTLNWLSGRTKAITLNQNTTFSFSNTPSGTTNIQTMVVQVTGDGASSVSFTGATWQTAQISVPDAALITLYVFRARNSLIDGYAGDSNTGTGLWDVVDGVLVPSPAQDYISFVSTVATSGTNIVVNIDTDSAQVAGETMLNISNNSTVVFRVDAVSGYGGAGTKVFTDNGTFQAISSATQDVFSGHYAGGLPTDVPTTSAALAYDLDPPNTLYQWDGSVWY